MNEEITLPRRRNPRAARRNLHALQIEDTCREIYARRAKRRDARAVQTRLESTKSYAHLRRSVINAQVQMRIDAMELSVANAERASVGLPPLTDLYDHDAEDEGPPRLSNTDFI